jgi:pyruvate dehydrogenase E2 component (dihydrolipoamide acetyltransferase)
MSIIQVNVPDIGDFDEVSVIELLVAVGDTVTKDQSIITVESDKASMEIPSSDAGVVKALHVKLGDKVKQGVMVLELEGAAPAAAAVPAPAAPAATPVAPAASAPAPAASAGAGAGAGTPGGDVQLVIPDIGDFKDVTVIEVLVSPGDAIALEQSLITIESDKASMEIPSSHAGTLKHLSVKVGDVVNIGDVMGQITVAGGIGASVSPPAAANAAAAVPMTATATATAVPAATATVMSTSAPAHNPTVSPSGKLPYASPSVRKFARELGVPLEEVKGSGLKGRITQADVQQFTRSVMAGAAKTIAQSQASEGDNSGAGLGLLPWPKVDFAKFGPVSRVDRSRIKKISAANLHRNWVMIPHVTNHDDADITELEAFRVLTNKENEKSGVKVTMLAFLIKACVAALKKFPEFNSSLDGEQLVMKQYFHIGFAADTPNGLVVPVIRDADKKGVLQISAEMGELAKKARDGKLGPAEMTGACFTISSLGGIGGRYFTPIINAPEVAILGVCRSTTEPVWDGKAFQPRLMLPLSLSWDHRVIDGAAAARFNAYLGQILADFRRVLL